MDRFTIERRNGIEGVVKDADGQRSLDFGKGAGPGLAVELLVELLNRLDRDNKELKQRLERLEATNR